MNSKTLIGAVLGGLTLFAAGFVFYVLLLGDYFAADMGRATPELVFIVAGEIVMGYLLTRILSAVGAADIAGGAKAGAMVGFLIALGTGLIEYGASGIMDLTHYLADAAVWAVRYGLAGAVVAWWTGRDAGS
ncbi:MAG: hypothetical protein ACI80V_002514 [Rhodothermales bacterium]|jgi:hypothetical protein